MAEDKLRGQSALFGVETSGEVADEELPTVEPWSKAELARNEKAAIGFYLSTHPLDNYKDLLEDLGIANFADNSDLRAGDTVTMGGIISTLAVRQSKKGNRFCMFRLEDRSGGIKAIAWGEAFQKFAALLKDDEMVIVEGRIEASEGQDPTLIVAEVRSLDDSVATTARSMNIVLPSDGGSREFLEDLFVLLTSSQGRCDVYVHLPADEVTATIHSAAARVEGSRDLQRKLEAKGCRVDWAR